MDLLNLQYYKYNIWKDDNRGERVRKKRTTVGKKCMTQGETTSLQQQQDAEANYPWRMIKMLEDTYQTAHGSPSLFLIFQLVWDFEQSPAKII